MFTTVILAAAMQKSCPVPNRDVTVTKAAAPVIPDTPWPAGALDSADVAVVVGPDARLQKAWIVRSTRSMALDQAALTAVRESTYLPKLVDCKPTTGEYLFHITFDPEH